MRFEQKDITTVQAPGLIAHGVNCQNAMGSGVARALYTKWPIVKAKYHDCIAGFVALGDPEDMLGDAHFVEVEPGLVVANCFTQEYYGRDGKRYASVQAIREALEWVAKHALDIGVNEIHIPRIGCGLGGLYWEDVKSKLVEIEQIHQVTFVVCDV